MFAIGVCTPPICDTQTHTYHAHTHIHRPVQSHAQLQFLVLMEFFCRLYCNKKGEKRPHEMFQSVCQYHRFVSLRVSTDEQRGMKTDTHCEKYRFCTGAAVIKEMLIVDADVNMMCGKVALHFQQP